MLVGGVSGTLATCEWPAAQKAINVYNVGTMAGA